METLETMKGVSLGKSSGNSFGSMLAVWNYGKGGLYSKGILAVPRLVGAFTVVLPGSRLGKLGDQREFVHQVPILGKCLKGSRCWVERSHSVLLQDLLQPKRENGESTVRTAVTMIRTVQRTGG